MNTKPAVIIVDTTIENSARIEPSNAGNLSCLIGGKQLIIHLVEEVALSGIENCFIVSSASPDNLLAQINRGFLWSDRIRIEVINAELSHDKALNDFYPMAKRSGLLIINAGVMQNCNIADFIADAQKSNSTIVTAVNKEKTLGMTYVSQDVNGDNLDQTTMEIGNTNPVPLNSRQGFAASNFALLSGEFIGRTPRLAKHCQLLRWQHTSSYVDRRALLDRCVYIERGCHVERNAVLSNAVVYENAIVDTGAELINTIVMPNTHIAANSKIENAIVQANNVFQL